MDYTSLLQPTCALTTPSVGVVSSMVTNLVQAIFMAQCLISPPGTWPRDYGRLADSHGLGDYDFVVIGAGSAGSVVASRLSENPKWKVLVLEAGGNPPVESEVPALAWTMQQTKFAWSYLTEPNEKACQASENKVCIWPRGKVIGGSGALNAMLYVRGNRHDYDRWLRMGNTAWGYDDVLPYFEKSVRPVGNKTHPQGYAVLDDYASMSPQTDAMILGGAQDLGLPIVKEFSEGQEIGYGKLKGTLQDGRRMSTGKTYLAKVRARRNLHVVKFAHVTKLNFDAKGRSVKSVSFVRHGKQQMEVIVTKEVILSAGSIESPKLLMLSGVGPRKHLDSLSIPVVHDLRVGDNLHDHLLLPVFLSYNEDPKGPSHRKTMQEQLDSVFMYLRHRKGPLSTLVSGGITGFINSVNGSKSPYPDVEYHFIKFDRGDIDSMKIILKIAAIQGDFQKPLIELVDKTDVLLIFVVLSYPKSVGHLRLRSNNYRDPPRIFANYLTRDEDVATLLRGVRHVEQLVQTPTFRQHSAQIFNYPIKECSQWKFLSDEFWSCQAKYMGVTTDHQVGTAKMGPAEDGTACVDPQLLLRGVSNLRVADGSIMPSMISPNTNAACIMIGERAADFVKQKWSDTKK